MHSKNDEINSANLRQLADLYGDVQKTKTDEGWRVNDAVAKASIERKILERVCLGDSSDSSTILCDHAIKLTSRGHSIEADVVEICAGGILLVGESAIGHGAGVLEIRAEGHFVMRCKCQVVEQDGQPMATFSSPTGRELKRVERLVCELLRAQADQ